MLVKINMKRDGDWPNPFPSDCAAEPIGLRARGHNFKRMVCVTSQVDDGLRKAITVPLVRRFNLPPPAARDPKILIEEFDVQH